MHDPSSPGSRRMKSGGKRREIRERLNSTQGFFYEAGATIARERSRYQSVELVETEAFGRVLLLDGVTQVAERWEYRYHEPMVHPALIAHPDPRRVLVIGGGDGAILRELLRYRSLESVDMVELDETVLRFSRERLGHINRGALDDPRLRLHVGDGRAFVEGLEASHDVVIMDMIDPSLPSRFLYTREFFRSVARSLRGEAGIFVMHGESPMARPAAFACIGKTLTEVFPIVRTATTFVPMYGTLWSFRYASGRTDPSALDSVTVEERLAARMEGSVRLTRGELWPALFARDPACAEAEADPRARVITDAAPDFPDAFEGEAE